ncbi:flagellar hook-basal body complex protein FliE [Sulfurirhabdus autotrophica]|uniref:Flagellar hook-basal body complex protein FliE n=1 Tax=Sulfurirhabdus autotrophica TaxID=1706046 RepID=A0A4R3YFS3_9PROT|nr:flagellar hook-basal body complex protein FliE [Sulfurirhabdus autotrophica]TCV90782.1 flagellar hook-basal body complex protein FliE [Sulfurirhabdus autotrophica]
MSTQGIEQLLGQLRVASSLASGSATPATAEGTDFSAVLKSSIDQVNGAQQAASGLAKEFELGAPDANLHEVMLSLQKANLSFQTMVQVRNKLVTAYQEIMNMQV